MEEKHLGFPVEIILILAGVILFYMVTDILAHRKNKSMSLGDATFWFIFWVIAAMVFAGYLWVAYDPAWAKLFVVGFVLEQSLSFDNVMVFMVIFTSFNIKDALLRRVLFYGILGAIIFRLIFASIGTALFAASPWVGMLFAAIVAWTAWKMITAGEGDDELHDYSHHWSVRFTEKFIPVYPRLHGMDMILTGKEVEEYRKEDATLQVRSGSARYATPAFLCAMVIQATDVMFAFDSVPAVIAVTKEPVLVWSAMIFGVMGLRAMFFILSSLMKFLVHLDKAIIGLLFYIAAKLAIEAGNNIFNWPGLHITPGQSMLFVFSILTLGVLASFVFPKKEEA
ncbi:MAG: TerC/Alx family metal homeostasis membrane protein [Magnetococcales bacterium]|nr:TerC/Alx family metal homeostasis membrane protein [Magnetococcales bacterium]NGZ29288.1 TerC/Alx family metal homeostasis membrane protein [Magnetococcales bacterium]